MPGVVVTTAVRTGPNGTTIAPASSFFVVGTALRGPIDETVQINGIADFESYFGGYDANFTLHSHVQTFFEEGGSRAYVARAVGASATAGTKTLQASGPTPALTLTAKSPGAWSGDVDVVVTAGPGGGFVTKIYVEDLLKYSSGELATVGALATSINAHPIASIYVSATALLPNSALIPAAISALSTGSNGSAPTVTDLVTALNLFGSEYGAGAVALPGQFSTAAYDGLLAHAVTNNRIALLGFNPAFDYEDAISAAADYSDVANAEYLAFYFPHVKIPGAAGSTLTISPEAYVAAKRSLALNQIGPWQAGAGVISKADFVTGVASSVDKTTSDALDEGRVNAIRMIQGSVRVYGARSASSDEVNWRWIMYRDFMNHIVVEAERVLEDLVFSTIDGRNTVFGRTEARLVGLLDPFSTAGGLYAAFDADGNQIDPGYSVEVSEALNPVSSLATGVIKAKVGVRPSSVGDKIYVEVVKSNLTSSVV